MPKFREITGQFVAYVPDGPDPDIVPDRATFSGRVTFTPIFTGGLIAFPNFNPPEFVRPERITARIIDGFVKVEVSAGEDEPTTQQSLSLMVTVDDEASQVWSWRADFEDMHISGEDQYVQIPSWSFRVPDGTGPIDLTELVPLKSSGTVDVTKGPRGAGLENITAVDGQLVFEYTDGQEATVPIPEAVQGPQGDPGPAGADGAEGPEGPQGPPGEIPDLLVGNITDATPTGKNLMLAATEGAARNALGLQAGATSIAGSLAELNNGTQTNSRVWSPRSLADYVTDRLPDIKAQATEPAIEDGVVWFNTETGKRYLGVDRGPDPIRNMSTNPRFKSVTTNLGTTAMSNAPEFKAVTLNLTYQTVENPSSPEYEKWVNRKVQIANFIDEQEPDIMGMQENQITPTGSSIQEVHALIGPNYGLIEQAGSNNGAFYNKNTFQLERVISENIEINRIFIDDRLTRNMTVAVLRHKASDQRLIYGVSHFNQDSTDFGVKTRAEAARICGDYLNALAASYPDNPGILLSGDFNDADGLYPIFSERALEASKNKAATTAYTDQGSYHGYNVNGNTSGNWIDEHYTNTVLSVSDSRLYLKFASGSTFPLSTDFLSDHHPVVAMVKFRYSRNVSLNYSNSEVTTGGNASVYYSTSWADGDDQGSACIKPDGSSTASAFYPGGQANGMRRLRWEAGKTYTVSVTARLAEAMPSPPGSSRCIAIGCEQNGGSTNFSLAVSNRIPNQAGVARLSVTFTLPEDTTDAHIRLLDGSAVTPMWVDKLLVEEGSVGHDYFDGDTLGCYWEGVPHGSPSVYPGPSWVEI